MERTSVGFIGLGEMGRPMTANLLRAGFGVVAYDVAPDRLSAVQALGARAAASSAQVAAACGGTIVSMVRTLAETEDVLFGPAGIAAASRGGLDVVVMSTVDPAAMADLAARAASHGLTLIDAPVSGGSFGAEAGTLSIMLAGDPAAVERVTPVLNCFGRSHFNLGSRPGMGQAVKLAHQIMLAGALLGVAEGLTLGRSFGLETEQILPVVAASLGHSRAAENWDRHRLWWEAGAPETSSLAILHKDLTSVLRYAGGAGLHLGVTERLLERLYAAWPPDRNARPPG